MEDRKGDNKKFEYTYSALTESERKRLESIRREYEPKRETEQSEFDRITQLDSKIKVPAHAWSITIGIVGALLFGLGLTMVLEWTMTVFGIIVMALGCVPLALAYPIYTALIARGKRKYGSEILQLLDSVSKSEDSGDKES